MVTVDHAQAVGVGSLSFRMLSMPSALASVPDRSLGFRRSGGGARDWTFATPYLFKMLSSPLRSWKSVIGDHIKDEWLKALYSQECKGTFFQ